MVIWCLGVVTATLAAPLFGDISLRAWIFGVGFLILALALSFYRLCGAAAAELIEFFTGAIEARRQRRFKVYEEHHMIPKLEERGEQPAEYRRVS
jgi:hypothetical protein